MAYRVQSLIAVAVFADIDFLRSPSPYSRQKKYQIWRPRHYALFRRRFGAGYASYETCLADDLPQCLSAHAPAQSSGAKAAPSALQFETLSSRASFDQGAATLLQRPECLVARNGSEQLVEVPWPGRFARRLQLHQVHVVDHAAVLPDAAVLGEEIVDRGGLHFGDHRFGVIGAGRVNRPEVVRHRRIDACLKHGRHALGPLHEAVGKSAGLSVQVPIESGSDDHALRGLQAEAIGV